MLPVIMSQTGVGSSGWKNADIHLTPFNLQIETTVTGSATYSLEYTMDDFAQGFSWYHGPADTIRVRPTTLAGSTANASFTFTFPVRGWRITVTVGTGTVTAEAIQAGLVQ